ncbi:MAG: NAD(+)/NADH kinase [Peptoniphilus sp.]|nr:NAD(+)/NADH kinase [Peptoniphilus sp.]MDD7362629.1 NAD(+)/NADH kinase [Bacillota bacterium]MDY6044972.1 NAD(+)/NADH kinase [Peptoniphilus sp.]
MSIGIIANPASGKDIRRLVSCATTIDNQEKVNIVMRILMAALGMGEDKIYIMPDSFGLGDTALDLLEREGYDPSPVEIIDMPISASTEDSIRAGRWMEGKGVACIVVLGGDGTSRAVAKGVTTTPLIPISTGTNNVYPQFMEGTVVGVAAGIADQLEDISDCCIKDKIIEIYIGDTLKDLALIDATVSSHEHVGSRAIWETEKILAIVCTRCHPASIGFSAVPGALITVSDEDEYGVLVRPDPRGIGIKASVAPGVIQKMRMSPPVKLGLDRAYELTFDTNGMIALDGEREIKVRAGERVVFKITQRGPYRLNVRQVIEKGQRENLFRIKED